MSLYYSKYGKINNDCQKGEVEMIKTIITFIFVFGVIVIVHEFGHYYFAKRAGIMVREFAIGMGPKLLSFHKNGTTYTLRLLPIGGYVRMAGLGEDDEDLQKGMPVMLKLDDSGVVTKINTSKKATFDGIPMEITGYDLIDDLWIQGYVMGDENNEVRYPVDREASIIEEDGTEIQIAPRDVQFDSAKLSKRAMTNIAGPMNNFILAVVLYMIIAFVQGGVSNLSTNQIIVDANAPAAVAGIKTGDKIIAINHKKTSDWESITNQISKSKKDILVTVEHSGHEKQVKIHPKTVTENGQKRSVIGIRPDQETSFIAKLKYGFTATIDNSLAIFKALGNLVTDFSLNKLGGPVAIFKMSENVANQGWMMVLSFTAMLSINIGIINLLPIPALDGGKLILNLYEAIRGKPMDSKKEGILTAIGFGLVMLLMILVTWNDIRRYFF